MIPRNLYLHHGYIVEDDPKPDSDYVDVCNEDKTCTSIKWKKSWGAKPVKGDSFAFFSPDAMLFGGTTVGLLRESDYKVLYLKSEAQLEQDRLAAIEKSNKDQEATFQKNKEQYQKDWDSLSYPFKGRVDRFVEKDGFHDFFYGYMGGAYEMFILKQAEALFEHFKKKHPYSCDLGKMLDPEAQKIIADRWFTWFKSLDYKAQMAEWPEMNDGHSGNTWGYTVGFAHRAALGLEV
jgi:hypothetical protein